jgi:prophage regulatory protein
VPLSRTTIWRLEKAAKFPRRFSIGANSVGWLESEIDLWIQTQAGRSVAGSKNVNVGPQGDEE